MRKKQLRYYVCGNLYARKFSYVVMMTGAAPGRAVALAVGLGACYSETEIAVNRLLRVSFCLLNIKLKRIQI